RTRMVSHLLNIHQDLAKQVAKGLRLKDMPKPADAAKPTREDLEQSPALSILLNSPNTFKGRKLGVLITDGVDIKLFKSLKSAVKSEGAIMEIVAPGVGGVEASDGTWIEAEQKIDGGPSVLYDAVALLPSEEGGLALAKVPAARDFVADAFAHMKFIGYVEAVTPLFQKAGVQESRDAGFIALDKGKGSTQFLEACRKLRFWDRAAAS
ncbi:MAG TPA: catalase HPII, partial [Nitrospirales bacterium]|nr:catalase HPII [Nitrospirales bacterium]